MKPSDFLTELSNDKLTQYKTAAAADASKADKEGDFKKGDKRFTGIVKATKKQFDNDAKNISPSLTMYQSVGSKSCCSSSPGSNAPSTPRNGRLFSATP